VYVGDSLSGTLPVSDMQVKNPVISKPVSSTGGGITDQTRVNPPLDCGSFCSAQANRLLKEDMQCSNVGLPLVSNSQLNLAKCLCLSLAEPPIILEEEQH
jgi:hypothetical protein